MARIAALMLVLLALAGCGDNLAVAERPSCATPRDVVAIGFAPPSTRTSVATTSRRWPRAGRPCSCSSAPAPTRAATRALRSVATRRGMDRDEYPPAVGRATARADVAYVPSSENRSHGATLGIKLRRYCDGTRFRYVFY